MRKLLKKYWWTLIVIAIVIFLLFLPAFINWCYTKPAWHEILEIPKKWTVFWGTYLSAIASFAMVLITWKTLEQMKKQWEDEHRPLLEFYFIKGTLPMDKDKYPVEGHKIEVLNIGKSPATELNFSISQEIINCAKDSAAKEALSKIGSDIQLSLLPNEARRFTICEKTINRVKQTQSMYSYYIADVEVNEIAYEDFLKNKVAENVFIENNVGLSKDAQNFSFVYTGSGEPAPADIVKISKLVPVKQYLI